VNPIFAAALELQATCRRHQWRYCFMGGVAVQRWGEPRLTQDVDLTIITGFGNEASHVDQLLAEYSPRRADAREFALAYRVLLLLTSRGIPADVALGAVPFEERAVARATPFDVGEGTSLLTCSAEDLVVFKVFAGRDKDWLDVEGIVVRQSVGLDEELVFGELVPLLDLKETPEAADRLKALLRRHRR
jgi:hypothetical protein